MTLAQLLNSWEIPNTLTMITQMPDRITSKSLGSMPNLDAITKGELLENARQAWQLEETLMHSLVGEDTFYINPDPLRNPLIFYLGHSAVFYINKLIHVGLLEHRINSDYEVLFEIGVDPSTPEELNNAIQHIEWPTVDQVWQYRTEAWGAIALAIEQATLTLPIHPNHPVWALMMAIEHSRIHFETSSMLLRQLPLERVKRPPSWAYAPMQADDKVWENPMIAVSGGQVTLGKSFDAVTYGWDSDYGHRDMKVEPFWVSQYPITNGEFLKFIQAGGYDNSDYWDDAAWGWKQQNQIHHPKFWRYVPPINTPTCSPQQSLASNHSQYRYRAMFDEIDLPLSWPVEVTHYEAMAFCRWKGEGYRLLSEAEWNQALLQQEGHNSNNDLPEGYNLNAKWGSPCPVGLPASHQGDQGIYDLRGNLWEWLGDTFGPLPGFQPHPLYQDYSAPFFDSQHYLMVGGSWASTGSYASAQCRNWFRPYFPQHVGFRLAHSHL